MCPSSLIFLTLIPEAVDTREDSKLKEKRAIETRGSSLLPQAHTVVNSLGKEAVRYIGSLFEPEAAGCAVFFAKAFGAGCRVLGVVDNL